MSAKIYKINFKRKENYAVYSDNDAMTDNFHGTSGSVKYMIECIKDDGADIIYITTVNNDPTIPTLRRVKQICDACGYYFIDKSSWKTSQWNDGQKWFEIAYELHKGTEPKGSVQKSTQNAVVHPPSVPKQCFSYTSKRERDHNQKAVLGNDHIFVTSFLGRTKVWSYKLPVKEWLQAANAYGNPAYHKVKLIEKYAAPANPSRPEEECIRVRIIDAQIDAIQHVMVTSKKSSPQKQPSPEKKPSPTKANLPSVPSLNGFTKPLSRSINTVNGMKSMPMRMVVTEPKLSKDKLKKLVEWRK
jgi:hypothetical protein